METPSVAEKALSENLQKCRCCFRMLIDDRKAVKITEEIRNQFLDLCQIEVNKLLLRLQSPKLLFKFFAAAGVGDIC